MTTDTRSREWVKKLPRVIEALNNEETIGLYWTHWIKTKRCYKNEIGQAESSRTRSSSCRKEREKNCGKRAH